MNWLGCALLVISAFVCGGRLAEAEGECLKTVDAMLELSDHLFRRVSAMRSPLSEVFNSFENDHLESKGFLPALRIGKSNVRSAWNNALQTLCLPDEINRELAFFGNTLGFLPLEEQLSGINTLRSLLEKYRASLLSELPKKQKCIKTVSLMIGLFAAIILM